MLEAKSQTIWSQETRTWKLQLKAFVSLELNLMHTFLFVKEVGTRLTTRTTPPHIFLIFIFFHLFQGLLLWFFLHTSSINKWCLAYIYKIIWWNYQQIARFIIWSFKYMPIINWRFHFIMQETHLKSLHVLTHFIVIK